MLFQSNYQFDNRHISLLFGKWGCVSVFPAIFSNRSRTIWIEAFEPPSNYIHLAGKRCH